MRIKNAYDAVLVIAMSDVGFKDKCICGHKSCDFNYPSTTEVEYACGYLDGYNTYQPQSLNKEIIDDIKAGYAQWVLGNISESNEWITEAVEKIYPKRG